MSTSGAQIFNSGVLLAFGALEGYAIVVSGLGNPQSFRDQMEFKNFLLMKVFLSGVGASMLAQSGLSLIDSASGDKPFEKTRSYSNIRVPYSRSVPGCLALGAGMYVAGSGPTMLPARTCSFVQSAPYVFGGMLAGGAVFSLFEDSLFAPDSCPKATKATTSLDGLLGVPYWKVAIPFGSALIGMALGFDSFFPHSADINRYGLSSTSALVTPIVTGCIIGFAQLPIRLISAGGQGGSTSVMRILATASGGLVAAKYKLRTFAQLCQPLYVYGGTSLGAYIAYTQIASGSSSSAPSGYAPMVSFLGGALMLMGARFANGCTCGHGISGMSELSVTSIAGGMSIFAGGIAAGLVKTFLF